jgi:hypothetical protein
MMRRQILEALTYPRMVVLANLDGEECSQHLYFNPAHPSCQLCYQSEECRWLKGNDEFSVLAEKPMDALFESLLFGIEYVDVQCSRASHNVRRCACESCRWVRDARRLGRAYRNRNGI